LATFTFTVLAHGYNATATSAINVTSVVMQDTHSQPIAFSVVGATARTTIPGDMNGDGKVSLSDLTILARAYGSTVGSPKWNPYADLNGDGKVSLSDLTILARHYGQHL
jgi:hypothetical protein